MKILLKSLGRMVRGFWRVLSFTRQLILNLLFIVMAVVLYYGIYSAYEQTSSDLEAAPQAPRPLLVNISKYYRKTTIG